MMSDNLKMSGNFNVRLALLEKEYQLLIHQRNKKAEPGNGIFDRYAHPPKEIIYLNN